MLSDPNFEFSRIGVYQHHTRASLLRLPKFMRPLDGQSKLCEMDIFGDNMEYDLSCFVHHSCCVPRMFVAFWRLLHLLGVRISGVGPQSMYIFEQHCGLPVSSSRYKFDASTPLALCDDSLLACKRLLVRVRQCVRSMASLELQRDVLTICAVDVDAVRSCRIVATQAIFCVGICLLQNTNILAIFTPAQNDPDAVTFE